MIDVTPSRPGMTLVQPGMRVVDIDGKALGTVEARSYDEHSEELVTIVVQYGLFGRRRKSVPAHLVKQIDSGVVTLKFSSGEFKSLGDADTSG